MSAGTLKSPLSSAEFVHYRTRLSAVIDRRYSFCN